MEFANIRETISLLFYCDTKKVEEGGINKDSVVKQGQKWNTTAEGKYLEKNEESGDGVRTWDAGHVQHTLLTCLETKMRRDSSVCVING
jgi:hypothetical protein